MKTMHKTLSAVCALLMTASAASAQTGCCGSTACGKPATSQTVTIGGHQFVDLQLPSGLLWAETNVGAATATAFGDLIAWGEIEVKNDCSQETYRYGTDYEKMEKYNTADHKTLLDANDDAASTAWGAPCRMPTDKEFKELADESNCTWTWVKRPIADADSVAGFEVKSRRNGNTIFLPAAGARNGKETVLRGANGAYWTKSLNPSNCGDALTFSYYFANYRLYSNARYIGSSIRPVVAKDDAPIGGNGCCSGAKD